MLRKMTADEMDSTFRRSVMKQFIWGEVHTIDGEIVVCIRGNETTVSATEACLVADAAEREFRSCSIVHDTGGLKCRWVEPNRDMFLIESGNQVVELNECAANEFAAALREAAGSLSQPTKNRTDDNLRSVFG